MGGILLSKALPVIVQDDLTFTTSTKDKPKLAEFFAPFDEIPNMAYDLYETKNFITRAEIP